MSYGCVKCKDCKYLKGDDWHGGCVKHWPAPNPTECPAFESTKKEQL